MHKATKGLHAWSYVKLITPPPAGSDLSPNTQSLTVSQLGLVAGSVTVWTIWILDPPALLRFLFRLYPPAGV